MGLCRAIRRLFRKPPAEEKPKVAPPRPKKGTILDYIEWYREVRNARPAKLILKPSLLEACSTRVDHLKRLQGPDFHDGFNNGIKQLLEAQGWSGLSEIYIYHAEDDPSDALEQFIDSEAHHRIMIKHGQRYVGYRHMSVYVYPGRAPIRITVVIFAKSKKSG